MFSFTRFSQLAAAGSFSSFVSPGPWVLTHETFKRKAADGMGGPWGPRAQALSLGTVDSLPQSMSPRDRTFSQAGWLLIH